MSDKKIQASRENGAKSHGPITPEGKQTSSQNALKHGLCSRRHLLLPDESEEDFRTHEIHWMRQLQPQTGVERSLACGIVYLDWQIARYQRIEVSLLSIEMQKLAGESDAAGHAFNQLATNSRALDLLHRYMTRARRELKQAQVEYHEMVARRKQEVVDDRATLPADEFQFKWGIAPSEYSFTYIGRESDRLPNEPEHPGIYTAMFVLNEEEAA